MNSRSKKWGIAGLAGFLVVGAAMAATTEFVDDVVISTAKTTVPVLSAAGQGGVVFSGSYNNGSIPATGVGTRMMWYPKKAAFRAGRVSGTAFDDASIGLYSTAFGYDPIASGVCSLAVGDTSTASGSRSISIGDLTQATGTGAVAIGNLIVSSGSWSFAGGFESSATANYGLSFGYNSVASGICSTAFGYSVATNQYSVAAGRATANGTYSSAFGRGIATGNYSTAIGIAETTSWGTLAIGRYNVVEGDFDSWVSTDPVFVIGNGSGTSARNNAFVVRKNGDVEMTGKVTLPRQGDVLMGEFGN